MIINTRPITLADNSNALLRRSGVEFSHVPMTRIECLAPSELDLSKLKNIERYDVLIFTSQSAVKYSASFLKNYLPANADLPIIAIGMSTQRVLKEYSLKSILPQSFDSAGIAQMIESKQYKKCLIFCGDKAPQLQQHTSAELEVFSCYQVLEEQAHQLHKVMTSKRIIILIYNIQTLEAIVKNIQGIDLERVWLVVASSRIQERALSQGIEQCQVASGPHDQEMVESAIELASR
ncbi:uroporphyrinogen-III synthase [Gammaproteobacteria bacterium]|nr:uroporphyrinogen-III synthase [Gammaproteobacteria bacterium]MDA9154406.1 uroporphyrinogen-III synthase [Gammaproteobacteria bacterium]MDA9371098.1 uroporphyrinogen-III synthase [Gammaproteobacteria bacterium]MDC1525474.1 uroporphyrinogen-III synthase [Gammaproteobacteria bacterium]